MIDLDDLKAAAVETFGPAVECWVAHTGDGYVQFSEDTELTFAQLCAFADRIGTDKINVLYKGERWYSTLTGGDASEMSLQVVA